MSEVVLLETPNMLEFQMFLMCMAEGSSFRGNAIRGVRQKKYICGTSEW